MQIHPLRCLCAPSDPHCSISQAEKRTRSRVQISTSADEFLIFGERERGGMCDVQAACLSSFPTLLKSDTTTPRGRSGCLFLSCPIFSFCPRRSDLKTGAERSSSAIHYKRTCLFFFFTPPYFRRGGQPSWVVVPVKPRLNGLARPVGLVLLICSLGEGSLKKKGEKKLILLGLV